MIAIADDMRSREITHELQAMAKRIEATLDESKYGECPECDADEFYTDTIVTYDRQPEIGVSMSTGPFDAASWKALCRCQKCKTYYWREITNF